MRELQFSDYRNISNRIDIDEQTIPFMDYLEWLMHDDFVCLNKCFLEFIGMNKLPNKTTDAIIEGILILTDKGYQKKIQQSNYYECNATCVLYVMRQLFTKELYERLNELDKNETTQFVVDGYREILMQLLSEVDVLKSIHNNCTLVPPFMKAIHTVAVHNVIRQEIYGSASFNSFADKEISASIGSIRQLIELRMRRAFGVMAYIDDEGNLEPLNMSVLFEILKEKSDKISFPLKLENIHRIYKWSNRFIHTGMGDYAWIPMYLEMVLRELTFGIHKDDAWDVNNGISTKSEILDEIKAELEKRRNSLNPEKNKTVFKVLTCPPECELL